MPVRLSARATAELDGILSAYPTENGHPGTVVGVVNKEGEMIYLNAAGPRSTAEQRQMERDGVFAIFSCTKLVTAMAVMQLVERGVLDLDAPIAELVPELAAPEIIVDSSPTHIETRKATTAMTLRHLITHTSGFTYSWYNQHLLNWVRQTDKQEFGMQHLGMPLVNEPGTKWEYGISSQGMDWAGITVERATGLKLGEYCQKEIFGPLGLTDSAFELVDRPDLVERLVPMNAWDAATMSFKPATHPRGIKEIPLQSGGGGMFSTAFDYLQIVACLLNGGQGPNGHRLLSSETIAAMFVDQCADIPDKGGLGTNAVVPSTDTERANSALVMLPGIKKGWGLSFLMNLEDVHGGRRAYSAEWGGIANLWWLADPTSEIGAVIFNSILPYGVPAFEKMEHDLQEIIYREGSLVRA